MNDSSQIWMNALLKCIGCLFEMMTLFYFELLHFCNNRRVNWKSGSLKFSHFWITPHDVAVSFNFHYSNSIENCVFRPSDCTFRLCEPFSVNRSIKCMNGMAESMRRRVRVFLFAPFTHFQCVKVWMYCADGKFRNEYKPFDRRSTLSKRPSTVDRNESKFANGAANPWSTLRDLLL